MRDEAAAGFWRSLDYRGVILLGHVVSATMFAASLIFRFTAVLIPVGVLLTAVRALKAVGLEAHVSILRKSCLGVGLAGLALLWILLFPIPIFPQIMGDATYVHALGVSTTIATLLVITFVVVSPFDR